MICPKCKSEKTKVIDKRTTEEAEANRRRRECLNCGERFTTYERVEANLKVTKRDGTIEEFVEGKIAKGIHAAAAKRLSEDKVEEIVEEVVEKIRASHPQGEVKSSEIGQAVLEALKTRDELTYLSFSTVHKDFTESEQLSREAALLKDASATKNIAPQMSSIKKRDGSTTSFDRERIAKAIFGAAQAVGGDNKDIAEALTDKVILLLNSNYEKTQKIPEIDEIQDSVEKTLIENGYADTAKAYILYRRQHDKERETRHVFMDIQDTVNGYMTQTDWRTKENSNTDYSFSGLMLHTAGSVIANYVLDEMYSQEIAEAHKKGYFHIHDLSCGVVGYCAGWSLKNLIVRGFNGVPNKVDAKPAKHLDVLVNQMVNFIGCLQMEFAGAQAFSSVDTLLAPFIKKDRLSYKQVKQSLQILIFSLNIPSRWGSQMPFSNLTFDWTVPDDMAHELAIVGGEQQDFTYADCQFEMDMVNRAFMDIMLDGDASGRIFTFPIPTYNLTKNFDWETENARVLFEMTARYGTPYFQNYIGSDLDPSSVRAMCCRLSLDMNELRKKGNGLFGAGEQTGSVGVVTINVNRLAFEAHSKDEYFSMLSHYMILAKNSLEAKRKVVERNMQQGLMPYAKSYLGTFKNHFSTIGLCGMNEACVNLLHKDIGTAEGAEFAKETLMFMRGKLKEFQNETGNLYNLEATPAEGASYRLAKADKKAHPEIYTMGTDAPYLTNSTQLPVNATDDLIEAIEHQDLLQPLYTGGTVFHAFMGEKLSSGDACKALVRKIAVNTHLPYFSITPTFSICPEHGYIVGEHFTCNCAQAVQA